MLVEKNGGSPGNFRIGDYAKIVGTHMVGEIIGFENGRWVIQVNGTKRLVEGADLERRTVLNG